MSYKTVIFVGPSAVGKTFVANELMRLYPKLFEQAKLYTTRAPRSGEIASDRIFVDNNTFGQMVSRRRFVVHDEFGGSLYGFTPESLQPNDRHLLVNAWPSLIPQFSELEHGMLIGMQPPADWRQLLVGRMKQRGDSSETIDKRLVMIEKDYDDLELNKAIVAQHGAFFVIRDNNTVGKEILPWIIEHLPV
jgi:guanylate kinase